MATDGADATRLMLVGELGDAVGLANALVRGVATRIGVDTASPAAIEAWAGPEAKAAADVVMVDLAVNLKDVLARLRDKRAEGGSFMTSISGLVGQNIADVERELILQTLRHCGGNRSAAAAMLGISVRTMRNKLRSFQADGAAVTPAPIGLAPALRAELAVGA